PTLMFPIRGLLSPRSSPIAIGCVPPFGNRWRRYPRADREPMARNGRVFTMLIEHELMHQETLLYMMQRLALELKVGPAWFPPVLRGCGRRPTMVHVPAGPVTLGAGLAELGFGWDNELPSHEVIVPGFTIDETPVTNGQFLAFVEDRGYERRELWTGDDWHWARGEGLATPAAWAEQDGQRFLRGLVELLPFEETAQWPVYVSLAEARAYARWRGSRILTEAEFHRAAFGDRSGAERPYPL